MSSFSRRRSASADDVKYARGEGARIPPEHRPLKPLEWIGLAHVGMGRVAITWAFGGGAEWMRPKLAWWGSLGILVTLTALQDREAWREGWNRPLLWLWPFAAFNGLVLISCLNPSFQEMHLGPETFFKNQGGTPWLPSSARPELSLQGLWFFDSLWIGCFNIALVVRQRRAIRGLLIVAAVNAFLLSVFGTVQKLAHAIGPYFGAVETRQPYFFASFIYHNHWGAFTILMLAVSLAVVWHYARRAESRDFLQSPVFGGLVALFFIAATIPLSGSRSSTIGAGVLLAAAFLHWMVRFIRHRRRMHESAVVPVAGALLAVVMAMAGVWYVARDTIAMRAALTRDQVETMLENGSIGSRAQLYRDTWAMAKDKIWMGWGMGSYPHVFTLYNSQKSVDNLPVFYRDAHSDWLQSFAEHGLVGSALLALCVLVPLQRLRTRHFKSVIPVYLLIGCGMVALYAWVEFPFGNLAVVLCWWLCFFCAIQYARLHDREAPSPVKIVSDNTHSHSGQP